MTQLDWHSARSDLSGIALLDNAPESKGIDMRAVRLYRLSRVRREMKKRDIGALIVSDPVNIRYTTGTRTDPTDAAGELIPVNVLSPMAQTLLEVYSLHSLHRKNPC